MPEATFHPGPLRGTIHVPGDKSISHRGLILGAVASGTTRVEHPNRGADVLATRDALLALGAELHDDGLDFVVRGPALHNPSDVIDARNSGTTARLLMGLCAGYAIDATFDGDASLRRRPMERIARPLRALGASLETTEGRLPARVRGVAAPPGGTFALELPSAQVKSAILLANLRARAIVRITGHAGSRDHTERMLRRFGRTIEFDAQSVTLHPGALVAADVRVPGDVSAAAFFIVAAATTPGSDVTIVDVGVNPTRTGIIDALRAMGAAIAVTNARERDGEPVADLQVRYGPLRGIDLRGDAVVRAIDELPVLAVAAASATGTTRIADAADLRAKESDRIATTAGMLRACGIALREFDDGLEITGGPLRAPSAALPAHGDHRIAMSIAAIAASCGPVTVDDAACLDVSFPEFVRAWSAAQAG